MGMAVIKRSLLLGRGLSTGGARSSHNRKTPMQSSNALTAPHVFVAIATAGLVGEVAFEIYARLISPHLFDVVLQPSNLVIALAAKLAGLQLTHAIAFPVHFLIGSLGFGAFVYGISLLFSAERVWLPGLVAGVILWFVAQGILAPFIGRSFMMDFGAYTQSSFVGHVGMTLLMARVLAVVLIYFRGRGVGPRGWGDTDHGGNSL